MLHRYTRNIHGHCIIFHYHHHHRHHHLWISIVRLLQSEHIGALHESDKTLKTEGLKSLNIKSSSKKVSLQLLSELRWVCDGAQIFRQVVPRRRTGVAKWTFAELCAQPWQWEVRQMTLMKWNRNSHQWPQVLYGGHEIPEYLTRMALNKTIFKKRAYNDATLKWQNCMMPRMQLGMIQLGHTGCISSMRQLQ